MSKAGPKKSKSRGGCVLRLLAFAALAGAVLFAIADHYFNLRSNLTYLAFRGTSAPLEVHLSDGTWKNASTLSHHELDRALVKKADANGVTWSRLRIRRKADGALQHLAQTCFNSEVNVIEFVPQHFQFATSFREHFGLTTARERLETGDLLFSITANFRDPKGKPLGLVVHEGQQRNAPFPAWTGYFFVKDGKPWFGPKTLFEETPGLLTEAAQGYPSVMKNHTVFSYVDLAPNKYFDGEKITYRAVAGMRQNGTIVFILSGNGGVMNVAEAAALAQKLNVQHATLLDGGRALQYSLRLAGRTYHFAAYNTELETKWKPLERQRSPVFITVRHDFSP